MATVDCKIQECERNWWFGAPGTCPNSTGFCECPDGFTGGDLWAQYNDCHLNIELLYGVNIAFVGFTGLTAVITLLVLVYLCWQCRTQYSDDDREMRTTLHSKSSRTESSLASPYLRQHFERKDYTITEIRQIFSYRKRVMVLTTLCLLLMFPLLNLPFATLEILDLSNVAQVQPYAFLAEISLGVGTALFLTGLWVFAYIFYDALPDVKHFVRLLDLNSVLVTHSYLMTSIAIAHIALLWITTIVLVCIVPVSYPDPEVKHLLRKVWISVSIVFYIEFLLVLEGVCLVVKKLYKESLPVAQKDLSKKSAIKLESAMRNLAIVIWFLPIPVLLCTGPLFALLLGDGDRYASIFFCISGAAGNVAVLTAAYASTTEFLHTKKEVARRGSFPIFARRTSSAARLMMSDGSDSTKNNKDSDELDV